MPDEYEYNLMATRRKDPDYEQVSGYVHKDLALKFRIICMTERLTQSDALEEALKLWTELKNTEGNHPASVAKLSDLKIAHSEQEPNTPEPKAVAKTSRQGSKKPATQN